MTLLLDDNKFDLFYTHDWGVGNQNHQSVLKIADASRAAGFRVWIDDTNLKGSITNEFCRGIDESCVVVVFITANYITKTCGKGKLKERDNCLKEFEYAELRKGARRMIAVVMEKECRDTSLWAGPVGASLAPKLSLSLSPPEWTFYRLGNT
eukprot:Lithocolla_globosa_v1_NODE_6719_length_1045_cov_5.270707.p1 type:complete len:152 gc:universal NODE_6719_length_1045_cov_5.270707:460-5(-)